MFRLNPRPVLAALTMVILLAATQAADARLDFLLASPLGEDGASVQGTVVQSDGTVVLAVNTANSGAVVRIDPTNGEVLSERSVGRSVHDLDIDAKDYLYVAAGPGGVLKLAPDGQRTAWHANAGGHIERVAASPGGWAAALRVDQIHDSKPGAGVITLLAPNGSQAARFRGHRNTLDVAVDEQSKTVIHVGWRQGHTAGNPVQIAYLRGVGFDGQVKWLGYDWSEDEHSERYLNRSENNMADTRGYRCVVGADGKLYAAYEAAGGNHIFRYSPFDIMEKTSLAGGDNYHNFSNSRSEHKTVIVRYDPETGKPILGQEFAGRLSNGRANAVRVKAGGLAVDAKGRIMFGGDSASGLPMTVNPEGTGEYTGGGYIWMMDENMTRRIFVTRLQVGATTHAVAGRYVEGKFILAMGGSGADNPEENPVFRHEPLQKQAHPNGGFFAALAMDDTAPPDYTPPATRDEPSESATDGGDPQDQPEPTPRRAEATETEADRNERIATVRLMAARKYLRAEKHDGARRILQQIVDNWPDTDAADTARELLDDLG